MLILAKRFDDSYMSLRPLCVFKNFARLVGTSKGLGMSTWES